jgi:hypothetical protein
MRLSGTKTGAINQYRGLGNQLWDLAGNRPSLDLPFADNKSLVDATTGANLVDFTRASSGTYVDSEGVIRTATTNLLLRSEEFDNASWAKSAGGVALSPVVTQNQAAAPNGTDTADLVVFDLNGGTVTGDFSILNQTVTTVIGLPYVFSVWARTSDGTSKSIQLTFNGIIPDTGGSIQTVTGTWQRFVVGLNSASDTLRSPRIALRGVSGSSATASLYLWGAQLEQSTTVGEYIPTTSTINSAPRFDHDPTTGESLGLLVEESRTNLLLRSEEFDDASWSNAASPTAVTPNTQLSPSGLTTADTLANTSNTSTQYRLVQFIASASQLTFSVFIKKGTHRFVQFRTNNVSSGFVNFDLDLNSAFATTATGSVVDAGSGWKRCIAVFPAQSITSIQIQLVSSLAAAYGEAWTPTGTISVYIWGAQLEAGSFPTSYIPTTTAEGTRAADVASISGSNYSSWANNNEGTIFSDSSIIASQIKTQGVWEFSGGAVLSSLRQPQLTANQFRAVIGGTFTGSPGTGASLTTGVTLAAVAYSGTAGRLQVGSVGADTTGSALDATSLSIGSLAGSTQLNGRIKRLTYWPARLPNETLQTITQ